MRECLCGAYDCRHCYPATYKKYIAQEKDEEEGGEKGHDCFEDEDLSRYRDEGRER